TVLALERQLRPVRGPRRLADRVTCPEGAAHPQVGVPRSCGREIGDVLALRTPSGCVRVPGAADATAARPVCVRRVDGAAEREREPAVGGPARRELSLVRRDAYRAMRSEVDDLEGHRASAD